MKRISSPLVCAVFVLAAHPACGAAKDPEPTDYQKATRGLATKEIRAGLSAERMLDLCIPTTRRTVGGFTEYTFELLPGYHGLTIIAKDGVLKRATEWSCTYTQTYFDELTPADEKQYRRLCEDNLHVPPERCIGRWGWERPRMRDWMRAQATGDTPQR